MAKIEGRGNGALAYEIVSGDVTSWRSHTSWRTLPWFFSRKKILSKTWEKPRNQDLHCQHGWGERNLHKLRSRCHGIYGVTLGQKCIVLRSFRHGMPKAPKSTFFRWHEPSNVHRGVLMTWGNESKMMNKSISCMFDISFAICWDCNYIKTPATRHQVIFWGGIFGTVPHFMLRKRASGNMWPSFLEMPGISTVFSRAFFWGRKKPVEISGFGCPSKLHQQGDPFKEMTYCIVSVYVILVYSLI